MSALGAYTCIDSLWKWKSASQFQSGLEKDQEWDEIINAIGGQLKHADSCSFELPETVNLLESFDMRHQALVRLCKTGCQNKDGIPIGKTLKFVSNSVSFSSNLHSKLSTCTCQTHAKLYQINYTETAFYNRKLLRDAVRCSACAMRDNLKGHCAYHECDGGLTLRFTF